MGSQIQLTFWERGPPLAAIATAELTGSKYLATADEKFTKESQPTLNLGTEIKETIAGNVYILRYLARASGLPQKLYGSTPLQSVQVDQWLDYAACLTAGPGFDNAVTALNAYLAFRSHLVGYHLSIADLACWAQLEKALGVEILPLTCSKTKELQGSPVWDKLKKTGKYSHAARWHAFIGAQSPMHEVAQRHNVKRGRTAPAAKQPADTANAAAKPGDTGSFDIDLPGAAEGKVVTRFPPEPSGFLHIGHAKALLLNQQIAQMYKGKMLLRFDDTNPTKEKTEYVESILQDVARLGVKYEQLTYTSDYFPQMQACADKLIATGILYADDTAQEKMREERMQGVESVHRSRPVEETQAVWQQMLKGEPEGLRNCLRFKMDMQAPNKALRDPVAYRCNLTPHWRTGSKVKAYPTYDYACPFVDSYEGVTHALRTTEYKDREAQYYWILQAQQKVCPELPSVHMWDFARLNMVYTVMSKRKLTWFVDTGRVSGWDDPRFPTVQGVMRRGMQLEALREFILSQGASKNITLQDWEKVWTINKRVIDRVCPRHTAVIRAGAVKLLLRDGPVTPEAVTIAKHKKFEGAGVKVTMRTQELWLDQEDAQQLHDGEEVTLMDWGNAIVESIHREGAAVTRMEGRLHLQGSVKSTKWKLTWLPCIPDLVPLHLVDFAHLITKKKVEEEDVFEDLVNPVSRWETEALGDPNMRSLQKGDMLQLERKGYFIVDEPLVKPGQPMVLFSTPDGHTKQASTATRAAAATAPNGR